MRILASLLNRFRNRKTSRIIANGTYHYNWTQALSSSLRLLTKGKHTGPRQIAATGGQILEIGSFEGLGTNLIYEHLMKGTDNHITCVDPFPPLESFPSANRLNFTSTVIDVHANFIANTRHFQRQLTLVRQPSAQAILPADHFSFIYVDGDHACEAVYRDALIAHRAIRDQGIILFDDYLLKRNDYETKQGIDRFLAESGLDRAVIFKNHQLAVRVSKAQPPA